MKKLIYSLFAVLALSCTFVACSDDDDDAAAPAGNPAEAAAGTYTGTWQIILDGDTAVTPGTVTLAPGDTAFVAKVGVDIPEYTIKVNGRDSKRTFSAKEVANIAFAGNANSFVFSNASGVKLGNFAGRIAEGSANVYFQTSERVGRKNYTFVYNFVGAR